MNLQTLDLVSERATRIEKQISFALAFQITVMAVKNMLVEVVPQLYAINHIANGLLFAIIGCVYAYSIINNIKSIKLSYVFILISFFLWIPVLLAFIFNPETIQYAPERLSRFFVYSYLTLFMLLQLSTSKLIYYYLNRLVYIMFAGQVIATIFFYSAQNSVGKVYGMTFGYYALIPVVILISKAFRYNKKIDYIFSAFGILSILLYGNRGPLITIAFIILINIWRVKGIRKKIIITVVLLVAIFTLFFLNIETVFFYFSDVLEKFGIQSRTINKVLRGNITDDSLRTYFWKIVWRSYLEKPIMGLGPLGIDVVLDGGTAHNFYLDVIATYGLALGSIILIISVVLIFEGFKNSLSKDDTEMMILFFSMSVPRMIIGGGFLYMDEYWWIIGLALIQVFNSKKRVRKKVGTIYEN